MKSALIGHTGFVGSNISAKHAFDNFYNSKNIEAIQDQAFDLVVCAGAPGAKWKANKEPAEDLQNINRLIDCLRKTQTAKLVLISTIDVYPSVDGVDESTPVVSSDANAYGKHRRMLEQFAADNFETSILRLPGVFGAGLKKNPIFDLSQNKLDFIHPGALMQFYYLDRIWDDVTCALRHGLNLLNIACEPTPIKEIAESVFKIKLENTNDQPAPFYDMQTKFAAHWGRNDRYLYSKEEVLSDLKSFIGQR